MKSLAEMHPLLSDYKKDNKLGTPAFSNYSFRIFTRCVTTNIVPHSTGEPQVTLLYNGSVVKGAHVIKKIKKMASQTSTAPLSM